MQRTNIFGLAFIKKTIDIVSDRESYLVRWCKSFKYLFALNFSQLLIIILNMLCHCLWVIASLLFEGQLNQLPCLNRSQRSEEKRRMESHTNLRRRKKTLKAKWTNLLLSFLLLTAGSSSEDRRYEGYLGSERAVSTTRAWKESIWHGRWIFLPLNGTE